MEHRSDIEPRMAASISESDERRLNRYLDGALEGEELAAFETELDECEDLRRLVREYAAIDASASRALRMALAPPCDGEAPVSGEVRGRPAARPRVLAAAALALIAFGVWTALYDFGPAARGTAPAPAAVTEDFQAVRVPPGEDAFNTNERLDVPLIDRAVPAVYLPAVSGPSQGEYLEESDLITVFDSEKKQFYVLELRHARTMIQPARIEL